MALLQCHTSKDLHPWCQIIPISIRVLLIPAPLSPPYQRFPPVLGNRYIPHFQFALLLLGIYFSSVFAALPLPTLAAGLFKATLAAAGLNITSGDLPSLLPSSVWSVNQWLGGIGIRFTSHLLQKNKDLLFHDLLPFPFCFFAAIWMDSLPCDCKFGFWRKFLPFFFPFAYFFPSSFLLLASLWFNVRRPRFLHILFFIFNFIFFSIFSFVRILWNNPTLCYFLKFLALSIFLGSLCFPLFLLGLVLLSHLPG